MAAVRIQAFMPWRRVVTIASSTLLAMRTGRPALRARAEVIGSILVYDLLPKPAAEIGHDDPHRADRQGRRAAASSARTRNGCWHDDQTVRSSSPSQWAMVVCGSSEYW